MLEIFPEGFEEVDRQGGIELAAYTDAAGEERMWAFFGGGRAADVEDGWEDRWRAFHRPVRVDTWHLYDVQSLVNAGGRGLLRGVMRDTEGHVVASVAQEMLLRPYEPDPA